MDLISHIERYLGAIQGGWKDNSSEHGISIASFKNTPCETVNTFLTLGLSKHVLALTDSKQVRHELVFSADETVPGTLVGSLLLSISEFLLVNHTSVHRGQVIRLPVNFVKNIGFDSNFEFDAIYCSNPVYFDDRFACYTESDPPTVMVLLIPIYNIEADFIDNNGWGLFEDILEKDDPDLFSLDRKPVTLN
jgi:Suppressor of fused protein (SUFU)